MHTQTCLIRIEPAQAKPEEVEVKEEKPTSPKLGRRLTELFKKKNKKQANNGPAVETVEVAVEEEEEEEHPEEQPATEQAEKAVEEAPKADDKAEEKKDEVDEKAAAAAAAAAASADAPVPAATA